MLLNCKLNTNRKLTDNLKVTNNDNKELLEIYENKWELPETCTLEDAISIYNDRSKYEEQIKTFIDYFKENNDLPAWISLEDLIFIYKLSIDARTICKSRIIWLVEWKTGFKQKIEALTTVYEKAPLYWDLKDYSFEYIETISLEKWLLSKQAEEYWFEVLNNSFWKTKLEIFSLWLKILVENISDYFKLKDIFNIINKNTKLRNLSPKIEELLDMLLLKMKDSTYIRNNPYDKIIEELLFLYNASCCSTKWREIKKEIENLYSLDLLKDFDIYSLRGLFKFPINSIILKNSLNSFKLKITNYDQADLLEKELIDKIAIISDDLRKLDKNQSATYINIEEKEKLENLEKFFVTLLIEVLKIQKGKITSLNNLLSFYNKSFDNKEVNNYKNTLNDDLINIAINAYSNNFEDSIKTYRFLYNNIDLANLEKLYNNILNNLDFDENEIYNSNLLTNLTKIDNSLLKQIKELWFLYKKSKSKNYIISWDYRNFEKLIELIWWQDKIDTIEYELNKETKTYIDNLMYLYNEWVMKDFSLVSNINGEFKKIIKNYKLWIAIISYILQNTWWKKLKANIRNLYDILISYSEKNIYKCDYRDLWDKKKIDRLISLSNIKNQLKILDQETYEIELIENTNSYEVLLYLSSNFKEHKEFIQKLIDEKLYLVSSYEQWNELYKELKLDSILSKTIDLATSFEEVKSLYSYCDKLHQKEKIVRKSLLYINEIYIINDLQNLYNKALEVFDESSRELTDILKVVYNNKTKIISKNKWNPESVELSLLLFIYRNTNNYELKLKLSDDIIKKSDNFDSLYLIINSIRSIQWSLDNINVKTIILKLEEFLKKEESPLKILNKLLANNETLLLEDCKEIFKSSFNTIKQYEELKEHYFKLKKENDKNLEIESDNLKNLKKEELDLIYIFEIFISVQEKSISKIKSVKKLKQELNDTKKVWLKEKIFSRIIKYSKSFSDFHRLYLECENNIFSEDYVKKTRTSLYRKMNWFSKKNLWFKEYYILYNISSSESHKKSFINLMKEKVLNCSEIIKLYKLEKNESILNSLDKFLNLTNYKILFDENKSYLEIRIKILQTILKNDLFNSLSFNEWKDIYNRIRKKEEYKEFNKEIFIKLLYTINYVEDYSDVISIYDNNSYLLDDSLVKLKEKIKNDIWFIWKWFLKIYNKANTLESQDLKNYIFELFDKYHSNIDNILLTLDDIYSSDFKTIEELRYELVNRSVFILQAQELLEDEDLFKLYISFNSNNKKDLFFNLLLEKLYKLWFNSEKLFVHNLDINREQIFSYIVWKNIVGIDNLKALDNKEMIKLQKLFFVEIWKKWNKLKNYVDDSKDEVFPIIYNKLFK